MRRTWQRYKFLVPYVLTSLLASILALVSAFFLVSFDDLPQIENLQDYTPKGITVLLSNDDEAAFEYFQERRIVLSPSEIPEMTQKAFLVAEDWNFYHHFGIDIKGIIRAMITNIATRKFSQGASTITQQLSRNLFLSHKKTITRKLKEVFLTLRIERKYSKTEILTLYLNQIYLGEGTYGIEQASQMYFGTSVDQLDIAQNALLASLPKNPNIFSPFKNPERTRTRRNLILDWMAQRNVITKQQMRKAQEQDIPLLPQRIRKKQNYYTIAVQNKLREVLSPSLIETGRLQVHSGYDPKLQKASKLAVEQGLADYLSRHPKTDPQDTPQIATFSMDVHTGEIRAMVGGVDINQSLYNRALLALRQPGSSIKPLLYGLALDRSYTQSTLLLDAPISFDHPVFGRWNPENYDKKYDGYLPLRRALEKSKNTTVVRTLQDIGIAPFQSWLRRLGFTTDIPSNLTIALGSASVYLPELASAYAAFANGGYLVKPFQIDKITDDQNSLLYQKSVSKAQQVVSPSTAFLVTDALTGVVRSGTARFANDIPCELAGKTGTTNQYIDSVFAGYSSEVVTVVWVGYDDNRSLGFGESGSRAAGRIWKSIMDAHCNQDNPGPFLSPPNIVWRTVDHQTGLLPSKYSADLVKQAYVRGTEPDQTCCVPKVSEKQKTEL